MGTAAAEDQACLGETGGGLEVEYTRRQPKYCSEEVGIAEACTGLTLYGEGTFLGSSCIAPPFAVHWGFIVGHALPPVLQSETENCRMQRGWKSVSPL
jgi:hypothetical protein